MKRRERKASLSGRWVHQPVTFQRLVIPFHRFQKSALLGQIDPGEARISRDDVDGVVDQVGVFDGLRLRGNLSQPVTLQRFAVSAVADFRIDELIRQFLDQGGYPLAEALLDVHRRNAGILEHIMQ
ncbi:hypothetical protein [Halomonas chromatireducens]|uniref:Uncharacterized protein n=1 Tax=Halomonas chromatireducens TaxID=507626 RepID=A0A125R0L2_9GAMM|nr:hypothetical protein [Halomonas chromatireducens]AMD02232.1 hypothetical protein LOKO_03186 [Halomonas chromatireducens]